MLEADHLRVSGAEIIFAGAEGVPKDAVACGTPVEWGGGSHSSIHPVVGVLYGYNVSTMGEAPVLDTTAIEVFIGLC